MVFEVEARPMNKLTRDKIKMGSDITWLVITGLKQVIMIIELYAVPHMMHNL